MLNEDELINRLNQDRAVQNWIKKPDSVSNEPKLLSTEPEILVAPMSRFQWP